MQSQKYPLLNNRVWLHTQYVILNKPTEVISKIIGCTRHTVSNYLKYYKVPIKKQGTWLIITNSNGIIDNKEVIEGLMLGDGHIEKRGRSHNPRLIIHQKQKEFVDFLRNEISPTSKTVFHKGNSSRLKCGRLIPAAYSYFCKTKASPILKSYHNEWYKNKQKILPENLILTPTNVLHWFMGDGSAYFRKKDKNGEIKFSTNNFTESEVNVLVKKFNNLGFKCYKSQHEPTSDNNRGFIIRLSATDSNKFYSFIGNCPVKCMKYKWGKYG